MAVVNYYPYKLSITCTSTPTPTSQDNSNNNNNNIPLLPTKIILPKKKPLKWSTGVAPGEYGGPPVTTEFRKYWGGEKEDPITSDEYIWNNDFMPRMKRLLNPPDDNLPQFAPPEDETSGFLNLCRAMSLDSMEVDLSKELTASKRIVEKQVEAPQDVDSVIRKWRPAPTRREQKKWSQAAKGATGGSDLMLREMKRPKGDPAVLAAESREQYMQLKKKLQTLTVGIGAVGLVTTYISYSPEIAASYGAGFIGALAYVRMLGNSIDSMADGARGVLKGAIGQPRILVPVVLVMIYNRWNGILVPEYGFMHLELIPMLVGFFTYKIATFTQALEAALPVVENKTQALEAALPAVENKTQA